MDLPVRDKLNQVEAIEEIAETSKDNLSNSPPKPSKNCINTRNKVKRSFESENKVIEETLFTV